MRNDALNHSNSYSHASLCCITVSESEVAKLFMKFSILDRDGQGLMTRNDFFSKFLGEQRHCLGDAIFNLIGEL